MRIFVVGTGRCGTCTFYQAARHATNFTARHESHHTDTSVGKWEYQDDSIEIASQLVIVAPILVKRYPSAKWVHLYRDKAACVESLARSAGDSMDAFVKQWWYHSTGIDRWRAAAAYYDFCLAQVAAVVPQAHQLKLETAYDNWADCWRYMGAEGDFEASRAEWRSRYNTRDKRGRDRK